MSLKDQIKDDLSLFFNPEDFAETYSIDGEELPVIVDNDRLKERTQKEFDGISIGEILFFVKLDDLGYRPEAGTPLKFGRRQMYVADCKEDRGVLEIILTQNRG